MRRLLALLPLLALLLPHAAAAQAYPERPIRLVVGYAPGGSTDIIARLAAEGMGARLGQPLMVENRGGAGGVPAAAMVLQQEPDGHTLMLHTQGPNQAKALGLPLSFDPVNAWAPVGNAALGANALMVHPSVPATNLAELVAYARGLPQPMRFATPGVGLTTHAFAQGIGIEIEDIRYRGTSAALNDLLAGRVLGYVIGVAGVLPHIQSGALRPLGVASARRSRVMPDLPTTVEQGFPELQISSFFGLVAPAGTPPDRIAKLHAALNATLADPDIVRRLLAGGLEVEPSPTPEDFRRHYTADLAKWEAVARRGNLRH